MSTHCLNANTKHIHPVIKLKPQITVLLRLISTYWCSDTRVIEIMWNKILMMGLTLSSILCEQSDGYVVKIPQGMQTLLAHLACHLWNNSIIPSIWLPGNLIVAQTKYPGECCIKSRWCSRRGYAVLHFCGHYYNKTKFYNIYCVMRSFSRAL